MTEHQQNHDPGQKRAATDRLAWAGQQLTTATTEFQKALAAVRDPARRRELTGAYVDVLQKALASAQRGLDRYSRRQDEPQADDTRQDNAPPSDQA